MGKYIIILFDNKIRLLNHEKVGDLLKGRDVKRMVTSLLF